VAKDILNLTTCNENSDVAEIHAFLVKLFNLGAQPFAWNPRRWEGFVYHRDNKDLEDNLKALKQKVAIVRDVSGIRGVVIPEYLGSAMIQTIPEDYETQKLLLEWSMENLRHPSGWLEVWCRESNLVGKNLLKEAGLQPAEFHMKNMVMEMNHAPISKSALSPYRIRSIFENRDDYLRMAELLNNAFDRTIHSAEEFTNFVELSPSFRHELHIVAEFEENSFAAHAGITAYLETGKAVIEPVCVTPAHRKLGLASIVINEGLKRAFELGVHLVFVDVGHKNFEAEKTYQNVGFRLFDEDRIWRIQKPY
jgi:GNAT superfamily N-acetyltransferase